jgi:hypothetical protein
MTDKEIMDFFKDSIDKFDIKKALMSWLTKSEFIYVEYPKDADYSHG